MVHSLKELRHWFFKLLDGYFSAANWWWLEELTDFCWKTGDLVRLERSWGGWAQDYVLHSTSKKSAGFWSQHSALSIWFGMNFYLGIHSCHVHFAGAVKMLTFKELLLSILSNLIDVGLFLSSSYCWGSCFARSMLEESFPPTLWWLSYSNIDQVL
jgi:hypothetical protein